MGMSLECLEFLDAVLVHALPPAKSSMLATPSTIRALDERCRSAFLLFDLTFNKSLTMLDEDLGITRL
jgi:hypothetical protein